MGGWQSKGVVSLYDQETRLFLGINGEQSLRNINQSYLMAIAQGDIPGHEQFYKIGYHPASTGSETTVWYPGTEYVFPTSGIQMEAVSTDNTQDKAGGAGALTMHLHYLDTLYNEYVETITLNGTTPVLTVATNILRVNSFHVDTAGANKKPTGNISIRNASDHTTIYSQCASGFTRSRNSVYTVPLGKTLFITDLSFTAGYSVSGRRVRMTLHANITPYELSSSVGLFFPVHEAIVIDNNYLKPQNSILKFVEKTDLKVSVVGESNAVCTSFIGGWLE